MLLRHVAGLVRDVLRYPISSGQWWLPVAVVGIAAIAVLVISSAPEPVTPDSVYVLF